ncbi:MAG: radical SAM protein [Candidatus Diapherotrites archaeon]|nr:radical SAM protein [Candidatus Diapherotrites archaeon]
MQKRLTEKIIQVVLKDLIHQPTNSKSRAELILDCLFEGRKGISWDFRCDLYFFFLKTIVTKMMKENRELIDTVKKGYCDYSIFKKALNKALKLYLTSIVEYGITTPQKFSFPFLVEFELTNKCNLACKHCYANAGKELADEINTQEAKEILNQLNNIGVPIVCFTGGEPFLRADFFELLEHSNKIGLLTVITSNGTLITKESAARLKELQVEYIRISLDSATPKTHDWLRGMPGAYEQTIQGIKNSIQAGIKTGVTTVLIQENSSEMEQMIELLSQLGCSDFTVCRLFPLGKGSSLQNSLLNKEELSKVESRISAKAKEHPNLLMNPLTLEGRIHSKKDMLRKITDMIGGCPAGLNVCAITPKGEIKPCALMSITAGDFKKQKFEEVWKNSRLFNELRDRSLLKGKCSACEFKFSCGGCRATAYGYTGDYLETDPITCMLRIK